AEEIKADVLKYSGNSDVKVYTIHGYAYAVIKEFSKATKSFKEPTVADEIDSGEIIAGVLEAAKARGEFDGDILLPSKNLYKIVSMIKHERSALGYDWFSSGGYGEAVNELLLNKEFLNAFKTKISGIKVTDQTVLKLLKKDADKYLEEYKDALAFSSLMDFDDLIFCADAILKNGFLPADKYKLVIVDEMQDTSEVEFGVMKKVFGSAEVLLCGDEFQTIYAWRGSEPESIINDFVKGFNAVTMHLTSNRRSNPELVYAGEYYLNKTFGYNPNNRPIGELLPENGSVEVLGANDYDDEAQIVFDRLKSFEGKNSDICVMARSNRYIANLYDKLEKINLTLDEKDRLKFFTAEGDYQFYKKPLVKDFLAFFRVLLNPDDAPSFERIVAKYVSGVGTRFLNSIKDLSVEGLSAGAFLTEDAHVHSDNFYSLINAYNEDKIVVYDLETTGLDVDEDEFIQISAIKFGKSGKTGELNIFVLPEREIGEGALKTHGYGLKELKEMGATTAEEALKEFSAFSDECVLVGHNSSSFDDIILKRESAEKGAGINAAAFYDTLKIASLFRPDLKNRKLSTLCEEFGITNERAHDAFSDVTATAEILKIFITEYILPTALPRSGFIEKHKGKFSAFYSDYRTMGGLLEKNDLLSLFKFIGEREGVKEKNPKDIDSANDLYLAIKDTAARSPSLKAALRKFLSNAALSGSQIDLMIKKYDKIPLITVHQSKGSEFDEVILVGADENEFPSYAARQSGDDEEEKRVFYVALSRAKKKFIITYSKSVRYGDKEYERNPSPYIENLPLKD
ncbi:MAG: UvrD-helicase domain-containing protein, partial [Clostridia bacterium]|nr:UvrD-helicase domain-containing protein [Clostridia bacterium]